MSKNWEDLDSDSSDDEAVVVTPQPAGLNDGTIEVGFLYSKKLFSHWTK